MGQHKALPDNLKSGVENLSGHSLEDVRVHQNSSRPAELNAQAYAGGSDIHLGGATPAVMPHEAWHVVQQAQGRVKPTADLDPPKPADINNAVGHYGE